MAIVAATIRRIKPFRYPVRKPTPADRWPLWTDQVSYAPTDTTDHAPVEVHEDTGERLDFDALLDREIERLLAWGNDAGDLIADELGRLRVEARITQARSAAELVDRREALGVA
jgi:hypothetical protein